MSDESASEYFFEWGLQVEGSSSREALCVDLPRCRWELKFRWSAPLWLAPLRQIRSFPPGALKKQHFVEWSGGVALRQEESRKEGVGTQDPASKVVPLP